MARTIRQGLRYFPLDVDIFSDIKIRKLIKYQGGKAITVYALLLCNIYKVGYYMRWDEELPFIISEQTGYDEAYIQEVIKCCMVLGLFSRPLFDSERVLTSRGIQERYVEACKGMKRTACVDCFDLLSPDNSGRNSDNSGKIGIIPEETPIIPEKIAQKKIKENIIDDDILKEKNSKKEIPAHDAVSDGEEGIVRQDALPATSRQGVYGGGAANALKPVAELVEACKRSRQWIESVCMTLKVAEAEVLEALAAFPAHMASYGYDDRTSMFEFRKHFCNYLRKRKEYDNERNRSAVGGSGVGARRGVAGGDVRRGRNAGGVQGGTLTAEGFSSTL